MMKNSIVAKAGMIAAGLLVSSSAFCSGFNGYLNNMTLDDNLVFEASPLANGMSADTKEIKAGELKPFSITFENDYKETVITYNLVNKTDHILLGSCHFIVGHDVMGGGWPIATHSGDAVCHVNSNVLEMSYAGGPY